MIITVVLDISTSENVIHLGKSFRSKELPCVQIIQHDSRFGEEEQSWELSNISEPRKSKYQLTTY